MCGLILLAGVQSKKLISSYTERLHHRGPDEQNFWTNENISIGFRRLAINGGVNDGRQPYEQDDWVAAVNGEIYNYRDLASQYQLTDSACDTRVLLPLYLLLKDDVIDVLDGFYSGVLVNPLRTEAICLRDVMGKKPLFVGSSEGAVFITSEIKAVAAADWFQSLPKGISRVNLQSGEVTFLRGHEKKKCNCALHEVLTESVRKRLPDTSQPVGLFLSGGLDSSIISSIASRFREDITYFILGNRQGVDATAAEKVVNFLKLKNVVFVDLPSKDEIPDLISNVVYITESFNPSIISNGMATYLLARAARISGIKVALTGEGADELFGGYHNFNGTDPWHETRRRLTEDMEHTELRRLDLSCMANGIEPRCPFLDRDVIALSDQLPFEQLYGEGLNKVALRAAFEGLLPRDILDRQKTSCDVGSGIRRMVIRYLKRNGRREREELLKIWKERFSFDHRNSYFHSYPVFDAAIDERGEVHR